MHVRPGLRHGQEAMEFQYSSTLLFISKAYGLIKETEDTLDDLIP